MAMGPKIDSHLVLADGGRTVKVVGPTGDWDRYAVSATFKVVVAQIQGESIVLAVGRSDAPYTPDKSWWDADAKVRSADENVKFVEGWASAWAIASVKMRDDSYEPYAWSVDTRLLDPSRSQAPPDYPPPWPLP
jgi:hypothetical protein